MSAGRGADGIDGGAFGLFDMIGVSLLKYRRKFHSTDEGLSTRQTKDRRRRNVAWGPAEHFNAGRARMLPRPSEIALVSRRRGTSRRLGVFSYPKKIFVARTSLNL